MASQGSSCKCCCKSSCCNFCGGDNGCVASPNAILTISGVVCHTPACSAINCGSAVPIDFNGTFSLAHDYKGNPCQWGYEIAIVAGKFNGATYWLSQNNATKIFTLSLLFFIGTSGPSIATWTRSFFCPTDATKYFFSGAPYTFNLASHGQACVDVPATVSIGCP